MPKESDKLRRTLHEVGKSRKNFRQRFGYVLGALPGVALHFLVSVAAWTYSQSGSIARPQPDPTSRMPDPLR
jgi:hypothetical protein